MRTFTRGLLSVQNKAGRLQIRVEPGVRALRGGNGTGSRMESSVNIPGLYSLQAENVQLTVATNERDDPSQVLIVTMNHSVSEHEMPHSVHAWRLPPPAPHKPWSEFNVNNDILEKSTALTLTQIPGELEHYEAHSFRHDAAPGEYVYVRIDKGLKSFGGYVLNRSVDRIFQVPDYPRELRIAQQGSLLSLSGSRTLTVMTRGVATLCVDIGRLLPKQIQHLVSQTQGTFSVPYFKSWSFDAADITEHFSAGLQVARSQARHRSLSDRPVGPLSHRRNRRPPRYLLRHRSQLHARSEGTARAGARGSVEQQQPLRPVG